MKSLSNHDLDRLKELVRTGQLTVYEANVEMVRIEGVREIVGRIDRGLRAALDAAVRTGQLGHMARDGQAPEVYYHPNGEDDAKNLRATRRYEARRLVKNVFAGG